MKLEPVPIWIRRYAVTAGLAGAVALAGCGGSSGGSSGGSTTAAASNTSTVKTAGTPIKVMVDSVQGNPLSNYPGTWGAAEAAAKVVNDAGGIDGHPLSIVTCNNHGTPNGAAACARSAVAQHVVAYTGQDSPNAYNVFPVLKAAKIPAALYVTQPGDLTEPLNYPVNGGVVAQLYAIPFAAAKAGAKTAVIVQNTFPGYQAFLNVANQAAKAAGVRIAGTVLVPPTTTTYAPTVQKVRDLKPDAVLLQVTATAGLSVMQTGTQVGFSPTYVSFAGQFGQPEVKKASSVAQNLWITSSLPPTNDDDRFAGIATYNKEMDAAGSAGIADTETTKRDETSLSTWLAVHALAKAMQRVQGPVTAASLTTALGTTTGVDLYGLATWSPGSAGLKTYPKLTDGGAAYVGPAKDGVYAPLAQTVPAVADSGVK